MFGWESAFRLLDGSVEAEADIDDVDFVLQMESVSVGEIKPKMERLPKWYVNNNTRKSTYTYDSDFKVGTSSLSGDLKHGHLIDAVLGGTTVTDQTTYDEVRIVGGDRSSMFLHFNHGDKRAKQLIGIIVSDLTINASEGNIVTFESTLMSAKQLNASPITGSISAFQSVETPPFHWKHVRIALSLDNMASSYNSNSRNYVEACKLVIKNETEYKNGAQSEQASEYANYYIEKKFEVEVEITMYPEDDVLWLFAPSESKYMDYGDKGTLHYENLSGTFEIGETITGGTSLETAIVVADWDSNKLFIRNKSGEFTVGETFTGGSSGATADMVDPYQEFGLSSVTGDTPLAFSTSYSVLVNGKTYTVTAPADPDTYTYAELVSDLDTLLDADDMDCTIVSTDIRIASQADGPESINIQKVVEGNDLLTALDTVPDDPIGGYIGGHLSFKITLERETNDFIEFYSRSLQLDPISEVLENIDTGVDAITFTGKLAKSTSDFSVWIQSLLHDNSYSVKY